MGDWGRAVEGIPVLSDNYLTGLQNSVNWNFIFLSSTLILKQETIPG